MGVNRLWEILQPCKERLPLTHLAGRRVCVDLSYWITQLYLADKGSIRDKPHLRGLFHRTRALLALNCKLIFVADGDIPAIKVASYKRRMGSNHGLSKQSCQVKGPMRRNKGSKFSQMIEEAKGLAEAFGIPFFVSLEEAEAQCAVLDALGICDGCFTADSDALLFGARTVYKEIFIGKSGEGGYVVAYNMERIQRELGLGVKSLIALGVLLGGDYTRGVCGLGIEKAVRYIKEIGEDNILEELKMDGLASYMSCCKVTKKSKEGNKKSCAANKENEHGSMLKKSSRNWTVDCQSLSAIDAYLKPKVHLPNPPTVRRLLDNYSTNLPQVRAFCSASFDWPPEKTDEYVLPKIAECNLREALTTEPTKLQYRVDEILKRCCLHGVEHFKVSWIGEPELKESVVPADLIERVYSEKVEEFRLKHALKCRRRKRKEDSQANQASQVMACSYKPQGEVNCVNDLCLEPEDMTCAIITPHKNLGRSYISDCFGFEQDSSPFDNAIAQILDGLDNLHPRPINDDESEGLLSWCAYVDKTVEVIDLTTPSPSRNKDGNGDNDDDVFDGLLISEEALESDDDDDDDDVLDEIPISKEVLGNDNDDALDRFPISNEALDSGNDNAGVFEGIPISKEALESDDNDDDDDVLEWIPISKEVLGDDDDDDDAFDGIPTSKEALECDDDDGVLDEIPMSKEVLGSDNDDVLDGIPMSKEALECDDDDDDDVLDGILMSKEALESNDDDGNVLDKFPISKEALVSNTDVLDEIPIFEGVLGSDGDDVLNGFPISKETLESNDDDVLDELRMSKEALVSDNDDVFYEIPISKVVLESDDDDVLDELPISKEALVSDNDISDVLPIPKDALHNDFMEDLDHQHRARELRLFLLSLKTGPPTSNLPDACS